MESRHATHGCCDGNAHAHQVAAHHCCGFSRHFTTKAERREALEQYREQLKQELTGVEERLEDLS